MNPLPPVRRWGVPGASAPGGEGTDSPRRDRLLSEGCAGSSPGAARRARILRLSGGERTKMQVREGHPDAQRVRRERALTQILRFRARFRIRERGRGDPLIFNGVDASIGVRSHRVSPQRAEIAPRESPAKKQRHRPPADRIDRRSCCLRDDLPDPSSAAGLLGPEGEPEIRRVTTVAAGPGLH